LRIVKILLVEATYYRSYLAQLVVLFTYEMLFINY